MSRRPSDPLRPLRPEERRQLERVHSIVEEAVKAGARLETGGTFQNLFYRPTVLGGVHPGMLAADEETFGPVAAIYSVSDDDAAVRAANATPYGLNASVWTTNRDRGVEVAKRLRYGSVNVNEGYTAAWGSHDLPLGGMKDSGLGRRHGREGLLRYTEPQSIAVQRVHAIGPIGGMSFDRFADSLTQALRVMRRAGRP